MENTKNSDNNINYLKLGQNIRDIRKSINMTQDEFSEKLNITSHFLSRVENGNSGISLENAINICNIAHCSPIILFKGLISPSNIIDSYELLNDRDKDVIKKVIIALLNS